MMTSPSRRLMQSSLRLALAGRKGSGRDRSTIPGRFVHGGDFLLVKVGVADTNRVIELEAESAESIKTVLEEAYSTGKSILWFEDTKSRLIGVPLEKVAYVEIDQESDSRQVGFARSGG